MFNLHHLLSDVLYFFYEKMIVLRFAFRKLKGIIRQEPRFCYITSLSKSLYDGLAVGSNEYFHLQRYEFAQKYVAGKKVLNAACGTGYGSEILARAGASVIGIDLYNEPLQIARKNFPGHVFVQADVTRLHMFRDNSFDCIVSFETIEHLKDPASCLREFLRVLRPDGQIIASIPVQIYHNPGQNYTYTGAKSYILGFFPHSTFYLQSAPGIVPDKRVNWRRIRLQKEKFLLFHWQRQFVM